MTSLTVTECVNTLNEVLYSQVVAVEGEVHSYTVSQGRWIFFSIRDSESVLECFAVAFKIRTPLEDGMTVRIVGTPGIYKKNGRFRITVDQLSIVGEGALQRAYELLKQQITSEGLTDVSRKRSLPTYPTKIALVASVGSAAYSDFIKVLNQRWGGMEIDVYDVTVQGQTAVNEITLALQRINESRTPYDLLVLTRGGGSLEDLQAFNDETVVRSVATSRVPVVTGVGHERDVTLVDLVCDVRASTPSNAAELISPTRSSEVQFLTSNAQLFSKYIFNRILKEQQLLSYNVQALFGTVVWQRQNTDQLINRLIISFKRGHKQILDYQNRNTLQSNRLISALHKKVAYSKKNIEQQTRSLMAHSPNNKLKQGYAIVKRNNHIIKSVQDVETGTTLQIIVSDGKISTVVKSNI